MTSKPKVAWIDVVRRVMKRFYADLPKDYVTHGRWPVPHEHDLLAENNPDVPDATYRGAGTEGLFTWAGGKLIDVVRVPPDYVGDARIIALDEIAEAANRFGGPGHQL